VRKISAELRPGVLDHLGLPAALDWQLEEFQTRTGIRCQISQPRREPALSPRQATGVFRIFQEILTNVARHARAGNVRAGLRFDGGQLVLMVTDDGVGIAPERIFDPASLGLLGMRERALLLGGAVEIKPGRRRGTTVTVRIPVSAGVRPPEKLQPAASETVKTGSAADRPARILLADDHAVVRRGLKEILASHFRNPHFGEASDGDEVLQLLKEQSWDILLLDLTMPGRSGRNVLRSMKRSGDCTPVLVVSMHSESQYGGRLQSEGAAGYLNKADAGGSLIRAVEDVLAGRTYFRARTDSSVEEKKFQ
jgi:CheY-like chemotaxis protein